MHVLDTNPTEDIRGRTAQAIIDAMGIGEGDSDEEDMSIPEGEWVRLWIEGFFFFPSTDQTFNNKRGSIAGEPY